MNDKQQLAAMGKHLAEQHPMCLAKRVGELEAQCAEIADLLREAIGEVPQTQSFPSRCDKALSGAAIFQSVFTPEGWQLVPVEPTREMREAFHEAHDEWESGDNWRLDSPDHQWRAMLAAAPAPEAK